MEKSKPVPRARVLASCLAGYSLCAAALHRTVLAHLGSKVLGGAFVGGIFVWETAWFDHCRAAWLNPFFTRQLMHPMGVPVIVESPWNALLGLLLCPLIGPFRAVNLLFLLNYALSGAAMAALALELTEDAGASFLAGFFFMFSQYALVQHILGHLHESTVYPLPLLFLGAILLLEGRRGGWPLFTAALVVTGLASVYLALEAILIGLPAFLLLSRRELAGPRAGEGLRKMAASAVVGAALMALAYLPVLMRRGQFVGGSGFYSLSALSFVDFPAWHPSGWVQALRLKTAGLVNLAAIDPAHPDRRDFAFRSQPENLIGFFGLTFIGLLATGAWRGHLKGRRAWLGLAALGAVLALGPRLQWAYDGGRLPLPYALLQLLPPLRDFRAPARMIVLSWVALCALAAIAFSGLTRDWRPWRRAILGAVLMSCYGWEMGLSVIGNQSIDVPATGVLARLRGNPAPGALLELPVSIAGNGDISVNAERFMLYQPVHGRALVLGRPVRYTEDSLDFCLTEPLASDLTHPDGLERLFAGPEAGARVRRLSRLGVASLRKGGIRFVLLHSRDGFFSPRARALYRRLLLASLGPPVDADENGDLLFEVPAGRRRL